MDFIVQVFAVFVMLGILSILIVVHECGHFLVARLFGFQTPVFGIGLPFGPHITLGKKWDTEFRIYAFLLGGFVAIPELGDESQMEAAYGASPAEKKAESGDGEGEKSETVAAAPAAEGELAEAIAERITEKDLAEDENAPPLEEEAVGNAFGVPLKPFKKFPIWQRALVAVAGVTFNVIFAYLIMVFMLLTMGDPTYKTTVRAVIPSNPIAKKAGVLANDILVSIDNEKITTPESAVKYLTARKSTEVTLHLLRNEEPVDIQLTTSAKGTVGMVLETGSGPTQYEKVDRSIFETLGVAGTRLYELTEGMCSALGQMAKSVFMNVIGATKKVAGEPNIGPGDVHGVLAVIKIGSDIARQDWSKLFLFTILISMDLAIINLLPWPALDGGHLAFMLFEAVRGRPMGERAQGEIVKWGFVSLLVLMAVIMVNDITALVQGKLDFKKIESEAKKKGEAERQKNLEKILNRKAPEEESAKDEAVEDGAQKAPAESEAGSESP